MGNTSSHQNAAELQEADFIARERKWQSQWGDAASPPTAKRDDEMTVTRDKSWEKGAQERQGYFFTMRATEGLQGPNSFRGSRVGYRTAQYSTIYFVRR